MGGVGEIQSGGAGKGVDTLKNQKAIFLNNTVGASDGDDIKNAKTSSKVEPEKKLSDREVIYKELRSLGYEKKEREAIIKDIDSFKDWTNSKVLESRYKEHIVQVGVDMLKLGKSLDKVKNLFENMSNLIRHSDTLPFQEPQAAVDQALYAAVESLKKGKSSEQAKQDAKTVNEFCGELKLTCEPEQQIHIMETGRKMLLGNGDKEYTKDFCQKMDDLYTWGRLELTCSPRDEAYIIECGAKKWKSIEASRPNQEKQVKKEDQIAIRDFCKSLDEIANLAKDLEKDYHRKFMIDKAITMFSERRLDKGTRRNYTWDEIKTTCQAMVDHYSVNF